MHHKQLSCAARAVPFLRLSQWALYDILRFLGIHDPLPMTCRHNRRTRAFIESNLAIDQLQAIKPDDRNRMFALLWVDRPLSSDFLAQGGRSFMLHRASLTDSRAAALQTFQDFRHNPIFLKLLRGPLKDEDKQVAEALFANSPCLFNTLVRTRDLRYCPNVLDTEMITAETFYNFLVSVDNTHALLASLKQDIVGECDDVDAIDIIKSTFAEYHGDSRHGLPLSSDLFSEIGLTQHDLLNIKYPKGIPLITFLIKFRSPLSPNGLQYCEKDPSLFPIAFNNRDYKTLTALIETGSLYADSWLSDLPNWALSGAKQRHLKTDSLLEWALQRLFDTNSTEDVERLCKTLITHYAPLDCEHLHLAIRAKNLNLIHQLVTTNNDLLTTYLTYRDGPHLLHKIMGEDLWRQDPEKAMTLATVIAKHHVTFRTDLNSIRQTPLHVAAEGNKTAVLLALLECPENRAHLKECQIDATDKHGDSALILAGNEGNVDSFNLLLDSGANPHTMDDFSRSALFWTLFRASKVTDPKPYLEMSKSLLEAGVETNLVSTKKGTPLLYAIDGGHVDMVSQLLTAGAHPNALEGSESPLLRAIELNVDPLVDTLLEAGADPNGSKGSEYPLLRAIKMGSVSMARALLEAGADPNGPKGSEYPLLRAIKMGSDSIVECLLEQGSCSCPPEAFVHGGDKPAVLDRLKALRDINLVLIDAIKADNNKAACILMAFGATGDTSVEGKIALEWAISRRNRPVIDKLTEVSVIPDSLTLEQAITTESIPLVRKVLEHPRGLPEHLNHCLLQSHTIPDSRLRRDIQHCLLDAGAAFVDTELEHLNQAIHTEDLGIIKAVLASRQNWSPAELYSAHKLTYNRNIRIAIGDTLRKRPVAGETFAAAIDENNISLANFMLNYATWRDEKPSLTQAILERPNLAFIETLLKTTLNNEDELRSSLNVVCELIESIRPSDPESLTQTYQDIKNVLQQSITSRTHIPAPCCVVS